ncbi:hypothetical protein [Massilia sp. Se16.2.3]|uniref:hypothetical protein n=1 Tax=Massilia sp. Se16.2.3 TaxID=2709303 RepID=UPI001E50C832|nr:hypothetical protein [Massilia sp. Se16.2.3]
MAGSGDIVALGGGHYRLCEQLGGSAYGLLWRARRDGFRDVALKLVNREQMAGAAPTLRQRWSECAQREIAFLGGLSPGTGATSSACSTRAATRAFPRWRWNCSTATSVPT